MNELLEKAKKIRCVICDVDGVLTDGRLYMDTLNNELKAFHVHDGMGLKLLMAAGIEVCIITTSANETIDIRMQQLGIRHYFKGQVDKRSAFIELKKRLSLQNEEIVYIGDDLPDLPIIQQVGLGIAVSNAVAQVKQFAAWTTDKAGGLGAVREACDFVLNAQEKHDFALERYLLDSEI